MRKVDFSKIELEMIDGTTQRADFQHGENGIANQIYMQAREIKWKDFGKKLYYAEGEIELTDEEAKYVLNFVQEWSCVAREGIERALKDKEE